MEKNETDRDCVLLKEVLTAQIATLAEQGVKNFLSGMALGVDYEKGKIMRSEILETAPTSSR